MSVYADNSIIEEKPKKIQETLLCYGYEKDLIQVYDFYCARYKDITYDEFLNKGISEIHRKLMSIPENEPLFTILKSRVINIAKIKNKDERHYWEKLKYENRIPDIYKPNQELDMNLNKKLGGIKNGKRFM